jgi:hypothetical protein
MYILKRFAYKSVLCNQILLLLSLGELEDWKIILYGVRVERASGSLLLCQGARRTVSWHDPSQSQLDPYSILHPNRYKLTIIN